MKHDNKKTLLLVEDEFLVAMAQQQELEEYGYAVVHANTGENAIELSKENTEIKLILMDIDLGKGIDGIEAAELILKNQNIPIVFLSSHMEPEIVEKTERITSYGYVVKSSSITVLDASIKMAFKLFEANNITEKHRQQLVITLNSIGDAVITTDTKGMVSNMNPVAEKLTGWDLEAACGMPLKKVFNIINAETRKSIDNPVGKVLETGQIIGLANHTVLIARDKKEYQIADSAAPIINLNGLTIGVVLVFRDVSEEYKIREDLQRSEKQHRLLFESMIDGVCLHEIVYDNSLKAINYKILDVNHRYEQILRLKKKDVIGKLATEVYQTDEAPYLETYAKVAETGKIDQFEVYFPPMEKHFLISIFSPGKGKFATVFEDITERRRIENTLKESMEDLRESQRIARVGNWRLNISTNNVSWSEELYKMYGLDPSLPPPLYNEQDKIFTPESWDRLSNALSQTVETGIPYELELETLTADGSSGWMWVRGEAEFDTEGTIISLRGAAQDISERKRLENKLKESELQFRNMANAGLALIWRSGTDKLCNYFNKPWLEFTGRTMEQELGNGWTEGVHPDDFDRCLETYVAAFDKREPFEMEYRLHHTSGQYRIILDLGTPNFNSHGEFIGYIGHCFDITERKKNEEEIRQQLLEKETLITEVHHRIKNNFATIEGLLSLQANSAANDEVKSALQKSILRIQSTRVLYEKLLISNDYQEVSIKSYIKSLVDVLVLVFPEVNNITIERNIMDFIISSKKAILVGIIINELMTNVFKYAFNGKNGGTVIIDLKKFKNTIMLTIKDNGIGIETSDEINSTSGFGLTIVKMLAEQLNGTFTINNDNGTSSIIQFEI